jgi:hypothetical protein
LDENYRTGYKQDDAYNDENKPRSEMMAEAATLDAFRALLIIWDRGHERADSSRRCCR